MKRWARAEEGFAIVPWSAGLAMATIVFVLAANVVAMQYVAGALQAAVESGARAGSVVGGSPETCRRRAVGVLKGESGLLRGPYGRAAAVVCREVGDRMEATASMTLPWWLPLLPPVSLEIAAEAVTERLAPPPEASSPWNGSSP